MTAVSGNGQLQSCAASDITHELLPTPESRASSIWRLHQVDLALDSLSRLWIEAGRWLSGSGLGAWRAVAVVCLVS